MNKTEEQEHSPLCLKPQAMSLERRMQFNLCKHLLPCFPSTASCAGGDHPKCHPPYNCSTAAHFTQATTFISSATFEQAI